LIPDNFTLGDLHIAIQIAMGWRGEHLHQFRIGGVEFSDVLDDEMDDTEDENTVLLCSFVDHPKQKFTYEYDFGDDWEHEIVVEKMLPMDPQATYPACLAGLRACPPEDCGGVPGYYDMLETLSGPNNTQDRENLLDWLGEEYDPEAFDLDLVNKQLAAVWKGDQPRGKKR
jgi:hypothetical protein